jgi:hypothetical protein
LTALPTANQVRSDVIPREQDALAYAELIIKREAGDEYLKAYGPLAVDKINGKWFVYGLRKEVPDTMELDDLIVVIDARSGRIVKASVDTNPPRLRGEVALLPSDAQGILVPGAQLLAFQRAWSHHIKSKPRPISVSIKDYGVDIRVSGSTAKVILYYVEKEGTSILTWKPYRYQISSDGKVAKT